MSKYEWEAGALKIPASEWGPLKRKLRLAWNTLHETLWTSGRELYEHLLKEGKGKRKFDYHQAATEWAKTKERSHRGSLWSASGRGDSLMVEAVVSWVVKSGYGVSLKRPDAPKKSALPFCPARFVQLPNQGPLHWDGELALDEAHKTLHWSVSENNHARDWAWDHPMGEALSKILNEIKWTRGSGGVFVGNDEYNQDNEYEGGGGNYVTRHWGPRGER